MKKILLPMSAIIILFLGLITTSTLVYADDDDYEEEWEFKHEEYNEEEEYEEFYEEKITETQPEQQPQSQPEPEYKTTYKLVKTVVVPPLNIKDNNQNGIVDRIEEIYQN